ncbi:hypothetical protein BACCAP_01531 [Pseudoflavonifractor capillosus ATCC 29799]|uniref:Uncharacterized protein n=1 Tax=Pseudoflavonifractor capillosus ATCC 29799 TaxID=411467 RepID=A6NTK2_9FIRM|nr:hypothetical protein BACCAP_01531 [Pseudoflavonifractor capillosus ATCC 29799]
MGSETSGGGKPPHVSAPALTRSLCQPEKKMSIPFSGMMYKKLDRKETKG